MDLESLFYFLEVAKSENITVSSEKLYMSQQTLSNHIRRVESYYGAELFYRKPRLELTQEGAQVMMAAEQIFEIDQNLKNVLADIRENDFGDLRIGAASPRSGFYLPAVLSRFSERFPNVTIHLTDRFSAELIREVERGALDFAFVIGDFSLTGLELVPVFEEHIYYCVSDRLLRAVYGEGTEEVKNRIRNGADPRDIAEVPLFKISAGSQLGDKTQECYLSAGVRPKVYLETNLPTIMVPLCNKGLAGGFSSHMNLENWQEKFLPDINIVPLCLYGEPVTMPVYVVRNRQHYMSRFARCFLELVHDFFEELNKAPIIRIVS